MSLTINFRHGIEDTATRYENLLLSIRQGSEFKQKFDLINIKKEAEFDAWNEITTLDYDEIDQVPNVYMDELYRLIHEDIESVLGEEMGRKVRTGYQGEDTGIHIDGHIISDARGWHDFLVEQSGIDNINTMLGDIKRQAVFKQHHPFLRDLYQSDINTAVEKNLLTSAQIEVLEYVNLPSCYLPTEIRRALTGAYMIKTLIDANLAAQYQGRKCVIENTGLHISLWLGDENGEEPEEGRQNTTISDIDDIKALIS